MMMMMMFKLFFKFRSSSNSSSRHVVTASAFFPTATTTCSISSSSFDGGFSSSSSSSSCPSRPSSTSRRRRRRYDDNITNNNNTGCSNLQRRIIIIGGGIQQQRQQQRSFTSSSNSTSPYVTHISPTTSLLRAATADKDVYLLGTAHISEASANEVIQLIQQIQPATIFLELDPPRAAKLRHSSQGTDNSAQEEELFLKGFQQLSTRLAGGAGGSGAGGIPFGGGGGEEMLKNFFRGFYALLKRYGYIPGIEMIAAMNEADRINAKLVYGDRDINDTFRELSAALSPALLMKAATIQPPPQLQQILQDAFFNNSGSGASSGLEGLGDSLEAIKTREYARMMTNWMDDAIPQITEVMLHRRDKIMVHNLVKDCCDSSEDGKSVLAVVGLAHMDGIEKQWIQLQQSQSKQQ